LCDAKIEITKATTPTKALTSPQGIDNNYTATEREREKERRTKKERLKGCSFRLFPLQFWGNMGLQVALVVVAVVAETKKKLAAY